MDPPCLSNPRLPASPSLQSAHPPARPVASSDPTPDGFVLWTRLAPEPLTGARLPEEPIEVRWEIADDENMHRIVQRGSTLAQAALAHSVHVEATGLESDRWYHYRFHAGDATSRIGRARTAPAADALPNRLRFAFASCQHFEHGYFTAYQHMLEDDLDLVVHLGDYIYEGAVAQRPPSPALSRR